MANTASPLVLDSPSGAARASARRKPETPRQAGNRLVIRIRNGSQPANAEGAASSSPPQQLQQQDQQPQDHQQQQQAEQRAQPAPQAQQQQQQQQQQHRAPRVPAAAADSDVIVIDSDSDDDDDEVVITGVTLAKKRPRQVLQQQQQQQQQPRAVQQPQQRYGLPPMPAWDVPAAPLRERSPEPAFKCLICLDGIKADSMATTPCGHIFCFDCIQDAVRATKKCPKCRKSTTLKQIKRLFPN